MTCNCTTKLPYPRVQDDEVIQTLPILLPEYDRPLKNLVGPHNLLNPFRQISRIFDAAATGQYLGVVGPRNTKAPYHPWGL